jgi:hypothetical protein
MSSPLFVRSTSVHDLAAGDVEGDAGDPGGGVGGEEEGGFGDVVGSPRRPSAYMVAICCRCWSGMAACMRSFTTVDGARQLTRMPWRPTSLATCWMKLTIPALAAA